MFVVDPFKGEAYKKLVAENCRIYGSGALISSLALKGMFEMEFLLFLYQNMRKISHFESKSAYQTQCKSVFTRWTYFNGNVRTKCMLYKHQIRNEVSPDSKISSNGSWRSYAHVHWSHSSGRRWDTIEKIHCRKGFESFLSISGYFYPRKCQIRIRIQLKHVKII